LRLARFNYCWLGLAVLVLFFSLTQSPFATGENFIVIIRSVSVTGLYALGNSFVFLGAGVDVSVIGIGAATAMVNARLFHTDGVSSQGALALAFLFCGGCGLLNGLLVTKIRIAPFIATLASGSFFAGITERVSGGNSIFDLGEQAEPPDYFFASLGRGFVGAVPIQVFIFLGAALASILLLNFTIFGRHLYAAGANPRAARLSGVNVDRILVATYIISGMVSGMAGLIRSSDKGIADRTGATIFTQGPGLLDSIGAVLIGGTALRGGIGTIQGTIGGSMILGVLKNGLFLYAAPNWAKLLSNGAVVIGAVGIGAFLSSQIVLQMTSVPELMAQIRERAGILWRRPARP
jgi:ribose/xylose/arabinose/galactoside ABC-type transport system permease subunit